MSANDEQEKRQKISGVFSRQEVRKIGTGSTTRRTIQKTFWFCVELDDGTVKIQPLNINYVPSGSTKEITREQFFTSFSPEPELYVTTVYPKIREMDKNIARGDRHREKGEYYSAEMEYGSALKLDEQNVRANFGLGITYLERGENAKAENIFERLVRLEAAFEQEHKHLFNEFGIKLRKNKLADQAVVYYNRALELCPHDEHLFYNLARAHLENKNIRKAVEYLLQCLDINPLLEPAVKFLQWMVANQLVPEEEKQNAAAALRGIKAAMAARAGSAPEESERGV